jgi:hypothetical protein
LYLLILGAFSMVLLLRRGFRLAVPAVLGMSWLAACASGGDDDGSNDTTVLADAGGDVYVLEGGARNDGSRFDGSGGVNPLCLPNRCPNGLPDDTLACEGFDGGIIGPPLVPDGGAGASDAGSHLGHDANDAAVGATEAGTLDGAVRDAEGGAVPDDAPDGAIGVLDASSDGGALDAGSEDASSVGTDTSTGGVEGGSPTTASVFACHVTRTGSRCEPAGRGRTQAPCTSSRDCAPGLACVGDASEGQCLPVCCQPDTCDEGNYCTERVLRGETGPNPVKAPVCVGAMDCRLDDPYPCDSSEPGACTCPSGTACSIVKSDGTTSCVPPGDGKAGDACTCSRGDVCTCAAGHMCVQSMGICAKLCHTSADCGSGLCQATPILPDGFGVCVGMAPSSR